MLDSTAQTAALSQLEGSQRFMEMLQTSFTTGSSDEAKEMNAYFNDYLINEGIIIPLTYAKELAVYRTDAISEYSYGAVPMVFNPAGAKP